MQHNNRQKQLNAIRSSLLPFQQQQQKLPQELEDNQNRLENIEDNKDDDHLLDVKKLEMVRSIVDSGYDQESAFYALKLVNFRSVADALRVLNSIKTDIIQQHSSRNNVSNLPIVTVTTTPISSPSSSRKIQNNALNRPIHRTPTLANTRPSNQMPQTLRQTQSFCPYDTQILTAASAAIASTKRNPPFPFNAQPFTTGGGTVIRIEKNQPNFASKNNEIPTSSSQKQLLLLQQPPQCVQRIFIDPKVANYQNNAIQTQENRRRHTEELNRKFVVVSSASANNPSSSSSFFQTPSIQQNNQIKRSISPLPESVAKRLKSGTYERGCKPCRPSMFRFFMEQHIEKLTQQFHERRKRARQLSHEMEAAGLADNVKENMLRLLKNKESKYLRLQRQKMNRSMFKLIRHIGIGAFGKVTLVRKKDTDQVYAMKTLIKADVIQKQQAAHVKAERDILAEANSPWIVKLFFSFQDTKNLYFIMEYVPGGDMMQLLINMGIFPESLARDIKPDNILIDKGGHIKLTDFGLCTGLRWTHDKRHYVVYDNHEDGATHLREDSFSLPPGFDQRCKVLEMRHHHKRNRAHSVVGTGNYMAPEVIQRTGHTQLCDWWSVGVILYEMVFGRPPFMSRVDDPAETQYMIVHWYRFLDLKNPMGARLSRHCIECIARLCCDQGIRLGHRQGAKDIKEHVWFKGIDFSNLRNITPEHVPRLLHPEDTSNFDTFEVCLADEEGDEGNDANEINDDKNINQLTALSPSNYFRENRENGKKYPQTQSKNCSNGHQQQQLPPNFIDFTFRHFFSDGIGGSTNGIPPRHGHNQMRPSLSPLIESAEAARKANEQKHAKNKQINGTTETTKNTKQILPSIPISSQSPTSQTTILQIGEFPNKESKDNKEKTLLGRKPFQALRIDDKNNYWSSSNEDEEENEWTAAASRC
ncbi:hypothetical protein Mgra_00001358 [Meloidogyne graminicola]|uniref:non-specific serine/threonine protein kinase n=1 Tax=Meloidogyne graminicola TaxID=189291 RepID=A0A8S9ZZC2_9BILA|nr:hypothetical protein Mgra_00001358 [Meloidogyne graminicola]